MDKIDLFKQVTLACLVPFILSATADNTTTVPAASVSPATTAPQSLTPLKNFVYPGIVRYTGGTVEGGDHLLGIGRNIGVDLEIYGDSGFPLRREDLLQPVRELFKDYRFSLDQSPPYLPFFYIVVIILPVNKGFSVYVSGRLLEKVELRKLQFDSSITWQAITWEKESFQIVSVEDATKEVRDTVMEIAKYFIDRVSFFESLPQQEIPKQQKLDPSDLKNKIHIKESNPKGKGYKPQPTDPKAKKEALLNSIKK